MLVIGIALNCIGIGLLQASSEWRLWLVGKFLNAMGYGFAFTMSPVWYRYFNGNILIQGLEKLLRLRFEDSTFVHWMLELSLVCSSPCIQFLNKTHADGRIITRGTSEIVGKWGYMSLIVIQYMFPAIFLIVYPFFPESPYFFIKKGKPDAARKSLNRIYGSGQKEYVDIQMARIQKAVQLNEELIQMTAAEGFAPFQPFYRKNLVNPLQKNLMWRDVHWLHCFLLYLKS